MGAGRLAVLRHELYAVPALLGAGVVVGVHAPGSLGPAFPVVGACLCFLTRMIGVRYAHRRARRTERTAPASLRVSRNLGRRRRGSRHPDAE